MIDDILYNIELTAYDLKIGCFYEVTKAPEHPDKIFDDMVGYIVYKSIHNPKIICIYNSFGRTDSKDLMRINTSAYVDEYRFREICI